MPVMQGEVTSFFREHMPTVDSNEVWRRCLTEEPLVSLLPGPRAGPTPSSATNTPKVAPQPPEAAS
jgi:hypothetical protein